MFANNRHTVMSICITPDECSIQNVDRFVKQTKFYKVARATLMYRVWLNNEYKRMAFNY